MESILALLKLKAYLYQVTTRLYFLKVRVIYHETGAVEYSKKEFKKITKEIKELELLEVELTKQIDLI